MFQESCARNRNAIYGVLGTTKLPDGKVNINNGTGFAISPGIIVTAAHLVHRDSSPDNPVHSEFAAIRAPDVGQSFEIATLIAEDPLRDVALLRITNPRSLDYLDLESIRVPTGTLCGSLGFPFAFFEETPDKKLKYIGLDRFQGSHISSFVSEATPSGRSLAFYETDSLMYPGSSGCPVFLTNSKVFGMQVRSRMETNSNTTTRAACSLLVPSVDIIAFARQQNVF